MWVRDLLAEFDALTAERDAARAIARSYHRRPAIPMSVEEAMRIVRSWDAEGGT